MKEFLANIQPPKYLRYLFYITYSWYRSYKSERDDAHVSATIFLCTFHMMVLLGLFMFNYPETSHSLGKYETVIPISILTGLCFYFLFIYQRKWRYYIEEFKHIKRRKRRIGFIYLFIYLFICIFIAFYPIILEEVFGIQVIEKQIQEPIIEKEYLRY